MKHSDKKPIILNNHVAEIRSRGARGEGSSRRPVPILSTSPRRRELFRMARGLESCGPFYENPETKLDMPGYGNLNRNSFP